MKKTTALVWLMLVSGTFAEVKVALYRNASSRYQLNYPSDWKLTNPAPANSSIIQISSPDGYTSVIVNPMPNASGGTAEQYISRFESENKLQSKRRGGADITESAKEAGGDTGAMAAYALDIPTIVTVYTTSYRAYMITFRTPAETQKGYSPINATNAKQIIASFGIAKLR